MNADELAQSIRCFNAEELAKSIRTKHDKLETECKQTVLAVELVALQMKLVALTARVAQLERDNLERTQTQDAKHERVQPR